MGRRDSEVVALKDMQFEYALLTARVELAQRDPTLLSAGGAFFLDPAPFRLFRSRCSRSAGARV